jgi:hypothetical protein
MLCFSEIHFGTLRLPISLHSHQLIILEVQKLMASSQSFEVIKLHSLVLMDSLEAIFGI